MSLVTEDLSSPICFTPLIACGVIACKGHFPADEQFLILCPGACSSGFDQECSSIVGDQRYVKPVAEIGI